MKIKLDRNYIRASKIDEMKKAAKEFKARYTENDLANAFEDAFQDFGLYHTDILKCDVEAFETNFYIEEVAPCFRVIISAETYSTIYKADFYTNEDLIVDQRPEMVTLRKYVLQ